MHLNIEAMRIKNTDIENFFVISSAGNSWCAIDTKITPLIINFDLLLLLGGNMKYNC